MRLLYTILSLLFSTLSFAQVGNLDPEFGNGKGHVTTNFITDKHSQGFGIAVQQDGKIIASGYTVGAGNLGYPVIARFMPDGTPDNTFNGNGKMILPVAGLSNAVAIQQDGKIVIAVNVNAFPETKISLYRFFPDGSPDNSFDSDGIVTTSLASPGLSIKSIAFQPGGEIVIGGYVGYDEDLFDAFLVVRHLPNGTLDETFDEDGIVTSLVGESYTDVRSVLIQPDGKIIAAGYGNFNNAEDFAAVRYNSNGTLDDDFGDNGVAHVTFSDHDDEAVGTALQADGKIVLGGFAYNPATGETEFAAARLNSDGTPDNSFNGDGKTTVPVSGHADAPRSMLLQPDGKIVLGGYAHSNIAGSQDMTIVRLTDNGIPDITFSDDGVKVYEDDMETSSAIENICFESDGKIVATGFVRKNQLNSMRVARFISGVIVATDEPDLVPMDISVYPNPVPKGESIFIETNSNTYDEVEIYTQEGRMVYSENRKEAFAKGIHPKDIVPGFYVLKVNDGKKLGMQKLIFQ